MTAATPKPATERQVNISRTLDAPRNLVFSLWTDPKHLAQWWGPHGFTNPVCEADPRPGGRLYIVMRGPDGTDYPMSGTFHEIVAPERLVFTAVAEDKDGKRLIEAQTTVTFTEAAGKTTVTVRARGVALTEIGAQMIQGMEAGWTQSLERLEATAKTAA